MATNQITEVRLLSVPLEKDYKHTLYFENAKAQAEYFISKTPLPITLHMISEASYQRKEGYIRFPQHIDDISKCNYLMFKNPSAVNTLNKWYYAFITRMEYKSDEVTWIYFELDVIQSFLFEYTLKPSFVEREHSSTDYIGENTIPENLECGEFVSEYSQFMSDFQNMKIVIGVTESVTTLAVEGGRYDGIYSGVSYLSYDYDDVDGVNNILAKYAELGKTDAVVCMFIAPSWLAEYPTDEDGDALNHRVIEKSTPHDTNVIITKPILNFDNKYKPRNNKLLTFPYKYMQVSNNNGASAIYHYEHFEDKEMQFNIIGCLTPGCSIRLFPFKYKGELECNEEGINLGKYPICNWTSDVYTNWLTQNSVNIALNMAAGVGQIVAGTVGAVVTGGVGGVIGAGQIATGATAIAGQLAQIHQMSFTPPQAQGNINSGDVTTAWGFNTFSFRGMTIKEEYQVIIDEYFDMFGYKTNRVKVPSKNHREAYWFTKTIDVNVDAAIPQDYLEKIKQCYNNGITFWKDPNNVGDYSVSNKCLAV